MPDLTNFVTTDEAAQELGFNVNHIRRMIRRGDLQTKRVGQPFETTVYCQRYCNPAHKKYAYRERGKSVHALTMDKYTE